MGFNRDILHNERKRLEQDLREGGIFSKDKMWQMDCQDKDHEDKRVKDYVKWKEVKGKDGKTNEQKMNRWAEINREFKNQNIEGRPHDADQLRARQPIRYD